MKTTTFNSGQTKWLTFLVYFLLSVLTFLTGWQQVQVAEIEHKLDTLPSNYVRIERYLCDRAEMSEQLRRIDAKLDRLIERIK